MNNQYLRLLNFFVINDSVTMAELVAAEHVSERTMTKYLQQLNQELVGAATIQENQHRYLLQVTNYQKLAELQMGHLKKRLDFNDVHKRYAFILRRLFQTDGYTTLDELADDLAVSKATLNRDLKQLRQLLLAYHAEITSMTNNGIKLVVHQEYEAPILVAQFIYDYFDLAANLTASQRTVLTRVLERATVDQSTLKIIMKHVVALKFTIETGSRIKTTIPRFMRLWDPVQLAAVYRAMEACFDVALTPAEFDYLLAPLTFKATALLAAPIVERQLQRNRPFFLAIQQRSELTEVANFEHLYEQIKYHFLFLLNRTIFHAQVTQLLPTNLLTKYPLAYDLAHLLETMISEYLTLTVSTAEFGYLVLYFEMELEDRREIQPNQFEVAIVGQVSFSVVKFIRHQLADIFDDEVDVLTFEDAQTLNHTHSRYLIIFSDQPIEYCHPATPIVRISTAFRAASLRGKLQVSLVEQAIAEQYCQFDFWHFEQSTDYLAAVTMMIRAQIAAGNIDETFMTAWRKREQRGDSVFENGIAMPHVIDQSNSQHILLQIGVFKRPVKYQNRRIQIICLIGIPQNLNDVLNQRLTHIYDLIFLIASNQNVYQSVLNYDRRRSLAQITEGI